MGVWITSAVIIAFWAGVYLSIKAGVRGVRDPLFRRQAIARGCVGLLLMAPATWLLLLEPDGPKKEAAPRQHSESTTSSDAARQGKPFPLTPAQFAANFNAAAKGSGLRAEVVKSSDATARMFMSKNCAGVFTLQDGQIAGAMVLGAPDGSVQASADVVLCVLYSMAGVRPEMPKSRRADIASKLTERLPERSSAVEDGVEFSLSKSEAGVLFTMTPAS